MNASPPKLPSILEQMMSISASAATAKADVERPPWPPNPFPKGIRTGSATEKVLQALKAAHPRWLEHWELMQITGRSRGAVSWGMRYLQERGMVRSIRSARHPSYLRYKSVPGENHE
ncbi:MAG: hypothetical protein EPO47_05115 [Rugosibacter sp.]|nr:MAG: hypothetical protein EPO60_04710 [Rugosibacter sp.]TBR09926.1 MAG: hypothetical protein EPO47_05115 [Rugosibacter sp.]